MLNYQSRLGQIDQVVKIDSPYETILGLTEVLWPESGKIKHNNFKFIYFESFYE